MIKQDRGTQFSVTATGNSTATATQGSATAVILYATDIGASATSSAGTVAVYGGLTGTTLLWEAQLGSVPYEKTFFTPLVGVVGGPLKITVNGTAGVYVNIAGFSINAA